MTHNQIEYAKLKEDTRHNKEVEQHNANTLQETNRHNLALESIEVERNVINANHYERMDAETQRHNQAVEQETNRHNVAQESIEAVRNQLTVAAQAIERQKAYETSRHNVESESISRQQSEASVKQAEAAVINANANERKSLTDFLALGNQSSNTASSVQLNQTKIQDLQNQMWYRKQNLNLESTKTGAELVNGPVRNIINALRGTRISGYTQ